MNISICVRIWCICILQNSGADCLGELNKNEKPVKVVKGNYNDKSKMAKMYAPWQTEKFDNVLNPDGSLPENEYGNIEVFNNNVPKGTVHLDLYRIKHICKTLNAPYKEAVTGFNPGVNGT